MGTDAAEKRRETAEETERLAAGPMTEAEIAFLGDVKGFIDDAIRNGVSFLTVLDVLTHDLSGIVFHGGSCDEARTRCFLPRVTGYSEVGPDSVGEPPEPVG